MVAIGIDLGTTNSCVAVRKEDGQYVVIENPEGGRTTPSVVAFPEGGKVLVGESAKRQMVVQPKTTLYEAKRLIGSQYQDEAVQLARKFFPFPLVPGEDGATRIQVHGKKLSPSEVAEKILTYLKTSVETILNKPVRQAVITVPAYFNDLQRQATKVAGELAGLEVMRIINEPTAAALAYGLDKKQGDSTVAVYDLGGGTFDISIIDIIEIEGDNKEKERQFEVRATNGDTKLGGGDFDRCIIEYLADEFKKEQGIDLRKDPLALQRLKEASEKAKIELSSTLETDINLPYITADSSGPKHLAIKLTRAKLNGLVDALIERTIEPCKIAMKDAGLTIKDIDEVILVGGQTRMPKVQETVEAFFSKKPRRDVNPDEAVAIGAAIQAGVLTGDVTDVLLLDVTPLSLGIETMGGVLTKLIEKNTTIPTKTNQVFSTAEDNQSAVTIHVLQGEREKASANQSLGRFDLTDIPSAPRGTPQIEVTFDIDANGILKVSAKNKATGKAQSIEIQRPGLSDSEIEAIKRDAEAHKEEDRKFQELIQTRNMADSIIHATEKAMKTAGDKLTTEEKTQLEGVITELKAALKGDDKALIEKRVESLTELSGKMSERLYAKPEEGDANGGERNTQQASGEDVVDAEFEEIKDKDKDKDQ